MEQCKKQIDFDTVINSLNENLLTSQKDLFIDNLDAQTSIHVIGAPRSGTTLLIQLLLTYLEIGYINNLTAAFYKTPVYGVRISRQLLGDSYVSQMTSEYGRTHHIQEPHEFSYFWKMYLNYKDFLQKTYDTNHIINWSELKEALYQITLAYDKPVIYKSFQYGFHAQEAVKKMPKTIFLYIERDLFQNAYSILKLRKNIGNEDKWASIMPVQYNLLKNENKYRQIIGQVLFLNYEYRKQLLNVPDENKMFVKYTELCSSPRRIIKDVSLKIKRHTKVNELLESVIKLEEKTNIIPPEIQKNFDEAIIWIMKEFPELNIENV